MPQQPIRRDDYLIDGGGIAQHTMHQFHMEEMLIRKSESAHHHTALFPVFHAGYNTRLPRSIARPMPATGVSFSVTR